MSVTGFSYAQAARGQSTSQTNTPLASSTSAALPLASQDKDDESSTAISQIAPSSAPSVATDTSKASSKSLNLDVSSSPRKVGSDAPSSPAASSTLAGTFAESASNFSLDDPTLQVAPGDKPRRVSTPGTLSPSSDDAVKKGGRKVKATAKTTDDDGEQSGQVESPETEKESAKVELAPAPLPTVNIWSQRMLVQAAKVKQTQAPTSGKSASATTSTTPASAPGSSPNSGTKTRDPKTKKLDLVSAESETGLDANGVPSGTSKTQTRRLNESTRASSEQLRRNGPRGNRAADKDEKLTTPGRDSLPSVQDAMLWPTPESAAVAEEPKAKSLTDKAEAVDKDVQDDAGTLKSRKKGWLPLPFVPTVNFQTPIPNVRGSKPKTGNRAGRDTSSRSSYNGGATNGAAPNEKASFVVPSPVDKANSDARDVAKENGSSLPTRISSHAPGVHKRFPTDSSHHHSREPRKPSTAALPDKPKEVVVDHQAATGKVEFVPKGSHTGIANGDVNGQHHQTPNPGHLDRRPTFTTKSTDHHTSLGKDFSSQHYKEQYGQSSRDRAEARSDRSSRGGFRGGRGGSSAQNHHLGHSTFQPNGQRIAPNAAYSANAAVLPPTAAPFSPPPQQFSYGNTHNTSRLGARNSSRPQLAPQTPSTFSNRPQNGAGNNPRLHSHSSHGAASGPSEFQMQSLSFTAFNPFVDTELLHGLTLQVEYYFSLDNLCKDVFLRRKMNDQGFVPLLVIARFKRMAELAPSLDFIRAACEQSENLDYVVDQDQHEWIRSRFLWSGFILPSEERDEEARTPGPDLRTVMFRSAHNRPHQTYLPPMMASGYPSVSQPVFQPAYPMNGNELLYSVYDSGIQADYTPASGSTEVNGRLHKGESQLSAAVPDFSPSGYGGAPTTLEDYQTYPDEQVEKLIVVVGSDFEPAAVEPLVHSRDGPLGLDGNSGSSQRSQANRSGSANGNFEGPSSSAGPPHADTSILAAVGRKVGEEPYPDLRAKAIEQRKNAKPGETPAAMKHLYRFWSHCLPDKFNVRMYEDFRAFALEDARGRTPNNFGLQCLLHYYNQVLFRSNDARPYPAVFNPHHIEAEQLSGSSGTRINGESRV